MIRIHRIWAGAATMVFALSALLPVTGISVLAADPDGYMRQSGKQAPLDGAKSSTVTGTKTADGCVFEDSELALPEGWAAIERRDVAINFKTCQKIVEEGRPTKLMGGHPELTIGDDSARDMALKAPTVWRRGYHIVWYEDVAGFLLTSTEADIEWFVSGGCVTSGTGHAGYQGFAGSGWQFVSGSWSRDRTCSRYQGTAVGRMKNTSFCSPATVWTEYYSVRAKGNSNLTITGSNTTDAVNECLPVFKHSQTAIVAGGNGGP